MKACKHGHFDGALHNPCYQCKAEYWERDFYNRLPQREGSAMTADEKHDEDLANARLIAAAPALLAACEAALGNFVADYESEILVKRQLLAAIASAKPAQSTSA